MSKFKSSGVGSALTTSLETDANQKIAKTTDEKQFFYSYIFSKGAKRWKTAKAR